MYIFGCNLTQKGQARPLSYKMNFYALRYKLLSCVVIIVCIGGREEEEENKQNGYFTANYMHCTVEALQRCKAAV
ncbi:hypothetical protein C0J52_16323 [Blattella germanica]|nr:hypothetical protein C0J52_16323 [Blattella germanica]